MGFIYYYLKRFLDLVQKTYEYHEVYDIYGRTRFEKIH